VKACAGQTGTADLPEAPTPKADDDYGAKGAHTISIKNLPRRILLDQKEIWLFPVQLTRGRYWPPTLVVAGGTAGLMVADAHAMPYFRRHAGSWDDFNDALDGPITSAGMGLVPLTLLAVGKVRHDDYAIRTGLLSGEAFADGTVVDFALKAVTQRKRPRDVPAGAAFEDTFFNRGKSSVFGSSFPSGHAVSAFSLATVVARRYGHHRWVPWAAYGAATAISLSRVTTQSHFPSDIFVGGVLGYSIARFEVLRH